ncbi:hypothetical protein [Lysobacter sp. CA199]|uniref:hypothetical protein n=1 Tax=Lysobacter sp. CA199 TaxID=3455608 RepID=UPI003F8D1298
MSDRIGQVRRRCDRRLRAVAAMRLFAALSSKRVFAQLVVGTRFGYARIRTIAVGGDAAVQVGSV